MVSPWNWQQSSQTLDLLFPKFLRIRALHAKEGPTGQPLPLKEPLSVCFDLVSWVMLVGCGRGSAPLGSELLVFALP